MQACDTLDGAALHLVVLRAGRVTMMLMEGSRDPLGMLPSADAQEKPRDDDDVLIHLLPPRAEQPGTAHHHPLPGVFLRDWLGWWWTRRPGPSGKPG